MTNILDTNYLILYVGLSAICLFFGYWPDKSKGEKTTTPKVLMVVIGYMATLMSGMIPSSLFAAMGLLCLACAYLFDIKTSLITKKE